jgi:copper(I)-binding protein
MTTLFAALALAATLALPTSAAEFMAGSISVKDPWARASIVRSRPAAAYMQIHNTGAADDMLTGAASPIAGRVEIHESKMEGGVMKMRPATPLPIPAGEDVMLKPGGYHVMLMQLEQPLNEGDSVQIELTFSKAGAVTLEVPVRKAGATDSGHGDHGTMQMEKPKTD